MIIRNETKLSQDISVEYSRHLILQSQKKFLITISIGLILVGVSLGIYVNIILGVIFAVVGIGLPFAIFYGMIALVKKKYKETNPQDLDFTLVYAFYDKYFEASPKDQPQRVYRCEFKEFFQINETKTLFIFQMDEKQAYYVSKKCFSEGTSADLRSLLENIECFFPWK